MKPGNVGAIIGPFRMVSFNWTRLVGLVVNLLVTDLVSVPSPLELIFCHLILFRGCFKLHSIDFQGSFRSVSGLVPGQFQGSSRVVPG